MDGLVPTWIHPDTGEIVGLLLAGSGDLIVVGSGGVLAIVR